MTAAAAESNPEPEDLALARAAAGGDLRAFERLYRTHVGRVHGLCCRLCQGDRARAEALTQDAFVRAWERIGSFRGEARFSTWLHRLTVNVVLGEKRQLKRWISFDDHLEAGEVDALENSSMQQSQTDVGLRMDLERAVARLPKGARTVLFLHDVEGYRHDEISELTGIAVGTSKAQLHRARRLLQGWLQ